MFASGENLFPCPAARPTPMADRKWKPNVELAPNCPRCDSSNTKFCYYNNYSLSQPRYFCKGCRRYWTKGGSLRNVPVGGGCRKNRRGKPLRSPSAAVSTLVKPPADDPPGNPGCSRREPGDASGIDLAGIYARFLNQPADAEDAPPTMALLSGGLGATDRSPYSPPAAGFPRDPMPEDRICDPGRMFRDELDRSFGEEDGIAAQFSSTDPIDFGAKNTYTESNEFGLEPLSAEGALPDILWSSNSYQMDSSNYTPPPLHLQHGLDSSLLDDHLSIHPSLQNAHWGTYDLPCFDAFSTP